MKKKQKKFKIKKSIVATRDTRFPRYLLNRVSHTVGIIAGNKIYEPTNY
jgi:hypothetical protein